MKPVTEEYLQKQDLILEAAFDLFKKLGFKRVSMADIAKASKISRTTLYRFFNTKRKIFELIIDRQRDYGQNFLDFIKSDTASISDKFEELIRMKFEIARKWGDQLITEILNDPEFNKQIHSLQTELKVGFIDFINIQQKLGNVNNKYSADFIYNYLTRLEYLVMDKTLQDHFPDLASLIASVLDISLNGLKVEH